MSSRSTGPPPVIRESLTSVHLKKPYFWCTQAFPLNSSCIWLKVVITAETKWGKEQNFTFFNNIPQPKQFVTAILHCFLLKLLNIQLNTTKVAGFNPSACSSGCRLRLEQQHPWRVTGRAAVFYLPLISHPRHVTHGFGRFRWAAMVLGARLSSDQRWWKSWTWQHWTKPVPRVSFYQLQEEAALEFPIGCW